MPDEDSLTVIAPDGDLILQLSQEEGAAQFSYRVNSKTLQQNSRYFENLLGDRFSEGQHLSAALNALKITGSNVADAPADALHRIQIVNVGRIAISKTSNIQNLVADFLRAVHNFDLAVASPPVANLANLAVLADRFDAVSSLTAYVQRRKYMQLIDSKSKGKAISALNEEKVRQKLLVGMLFEYPTWVMKYSKHLIIKDSSQWRPEVEQDHNKALWWDIPNGVEDEMIQRREYILETINSLQAHFLKLYTSGERQCKLGYDSSLQCDSFQLGEMIRFFTKINTLRLQGTIYDHAEPTYYIGDIDRLIESLRQASSYQIDRNHAHCGLRTRLMPLLDMIHLSLENNSINTGICLECWNSQRSRYAWSEAKRPVLWNARSAALPASRTLADVFWKKERRSTPNNCLHGHIAVRDFFMATERDWTGRDTA